MTFLELASSIRHFWYVVVGCVLVCTIGFAGVSLVVSPPKYQAIAKVSVGDPSGTVPSAELVATVGSLAPQAEAAASGDGVVVTASQSAAGSQHFTFTSVSSDAEASVAAANAAALQVAEGAKSVYDALQEDNDEKLSAYEQNGGLVEELGGKQLDIITKLMTSRNYSFCTFNVEEAMEATPAGTSLTKIVAAGALAGAFLGICIVALLDFIKKPIKGRRDIESSCSYPAIDSSIGKGADLLWANVRFALNDTPKTVAIVPACAANVRSLGERLSCAMQRLDEKASVREVSADLDAPGHFAGEESTVVLVCPPLAEGPGGAWAARESDATVVCVQKWADSRLQLADTIRELDLARAKVVGVVLFG